MGLLAPSIVRVGCFFTFMFAASTVTLLLLCYHFPSRAEEQRGAATSDGDINTTSELVSA